MPTSDVLPIAQFPQFASKGAANYSLGASSPYAPVEGTHYAAALHAERESLEAAWFEASALLEG